MADKKRDDYNIDAEDAELTEKLREVQADIARYDTQANEAPKKSSSTNDFDIPAEFGVLDGMDSWTQSNSSKTTPKTPKRPPSAETKKQQRRPEKAKTASKAALPPAEKLPPTPQPAETVPTESDAESPKERKARHKRRRAMLITDHIGNVVRVFAIGMAMFGGSIFLLVGSRPTESAEENRMLATFPSFSTDALLDGSYMDDVMTYYEDTVPGRSYFKKLISDIDTYKGLQSEEQVTFIGDVAQIVQETEATEAETEATTAEATTATTENGETGTTATTTTTEVTTTETEPEEEPIEVGDGIILVGDRAINVYGGSYTKGEAYAESLNQYKIDLGADVNVYSLVAPTAVSFYLPDSYASYTASEIDNIDHINEYLDDVIAVDAYHALEAHTSEDIYARTDHHWLPLGAYYAAQAFAEAADVPLADLSDYTEVTMEGYVGSMYTFTKSSVLLDNPEDFIYYVPSNDYTTLYYDTDFTNEREGNLLISLDNVESVSWYLVFMGGDEKIAHISTDVDNDRTLVIVKDSYGNALVPYLTQSFEEIYVTDMRYFDLNAISFMQEVGATDVLFAMNTFSATGSNSSYLETNRTQ